MCVCVSLSQLFHRYRLFITWKVLCTQIKYLVAVGCVSKKKKFILSPYFFFYRSEAKSLVVGFESTIYPPNIFWNLKKSELVADVHYDPVKKKKQSQRLIDPLDYGSVRWAFKLRHDLIDIQKQSERRIKRHIIYLKSHWPPLSSRGEKAFSGNPHSTKLWV